MSSILVITLLSLATLVSSGKILLSPASLQPVHRQTFMILATELIRRGHEVTWFEVGLKKPSDKLPQGIKDLFVEVKVQDQGLYDLYVQRNHSHYENLWNEDYSDENERLNGWLASVKICDALLSSKDSRQVYNALVNEKFDAVVVDDLYNPCGLIHTALQKSVFVYWSQTGLRTESAWAHHSPSPPSYIPAPGTGYTDEMDFIERSKNLAAYLQNLYVHQGIVLPAVDGLVKKHYAGEHLQEAFYMERNASINFVNHFPIFDFARPYMPRVNFVGGIQCRKGQKLEKKYTDFIADAEKGFVVISSGYSNHWKNVPEEVKTNLIEAIKTKPELKFIWQFESTLKNKPSNLLTAPWLPLQDLLAHEDIVAHISHGGVNSVQETVWHGVPVIGWPLTVHNKDNLLRLTARHAGLMLEQKRPTKNQIISALNRISVTHFKEEAAVFQDMVTDVPYTELNHSAFWVEFIVRHQEVPHARSGADELNILQYFLVDVMAFLLSAVYLIFVTIRFTLKLIITGIVKAFLTLFNKVRGTGKVKVDQTKKTN